MGLRTTLRHEEVDNKQTHKQPQKLQLLFLSWVFLRGLPVFELFALLSYPLFLLG